MLCRIQSEQLKMVIEAKKPITRASLDAQIKEVEAKLEDALNRDAFLECAPLHDKLKELFKLREQFPSKDELLALIHESELRIQTCLAKRDYEGAAVAQEAIDDARHRIKEIIEREDPSNEEIKTEDELVVASSRGIKSRQQLEAEISNTSKQLDEAIEQRNFTSATAIQGLIDELEKLRTKFPSLEDLQKQLKACEVKLDHAVGRRAFAEAEALNDEISALNKRIEVETNRAHVHCAETTNYAAGGNVDNKPYKSRLELEKAISDLTVSVSDAVSRKDFKSAEKLQNDVDQLSGELPCLLGCQDLALI
jgi:protein-arginine kinase activator protein McsA